MHVHVDFAGGVDRQTVLLDASVARFSGLGCFNNGLRQSAGEFFALN